MSRCAVRVAVANSFANNRRRSNAGAVRFRGMLRDDCRPQMPRRRRHPPRRGSSRCVALKPRMTEKYLITVVTTKTTLATITIAILLLQERHASITVVYDILYTFFGTVLYFFLLLKLRSEFSCKTYKVMDVERYSANFEPSVIDSINVNTFTL